jgi:hypothetical protein
MPLTFSDAQFELMRHRTDPETEQFVSLIYGDGDISAVNEFLQLLIDHDGIPHPNSEAHKHLMLPLFKPGVWEALEEYLKRADQLPDWADADLIARANHIFIDYGPLAFALLGLASLPELYLCGQGGTQVLGATTELDSHISRRIIETEQFVLDVMAPGGLIDEGRGVHAMVKIRLMHAAIRHLIWHYSAHAARKAASPATLGEVYRDFDREKWHGPPSDVSERSIEIKDWGAPISQQVMGGTILSFSYVVLRGFRTFGVRLSEQDEYAYMHAWSVVGSLMGIDEMFLLNDQGKTLTYDEGKQLFDRVIARNQSRNDAEAHEGKKLTKVLLDFETQMTREQLPLGKILPMRHVWKYMTVAAIGREKAAVLGIEMGWLDSLLMIPTRAMIALVGLFEKWASHHHQIAHWMFKKMAAQMRQLDRGVGREPFSLPPTLAKPWGLEQ